MFLDNKQNNKYPKLCQLRTLQKYKELKIHFLKMHKKLGHEINYTTRKRI